MSGVAGPPSDGGIPDADCGGGSGSGVLLLGLVLRHQRYAWRRGECARVAVYLDQYQALRDDPGAVLDLIYNEVLLREEAGEEPRLEDYVAEFPHLAPELKLQFEVEEAIRGGRLHDGDSKNTLADRRTVRPTSPRPDIPGYEILEELGRGGMGVVYRARQLRLNRIVAIKTILAGEYATPEALTRFLAEAEAVARLQHPNIVQIFALGEHEGRPYFEMEHVPGGNLASLMKEQPWAPRDAARTIEVLSRAVHEVHRLGIVHRDLKPANILIGADGSPKIADFGLAKWLDVDSSLTRTQWIVGSPHYMAPEQAGSAGGRDLVGQAADVYSLGAILYELLTGRPPFRAATVLETLEQVKTTIPTFPSGSSRTIPRDLITVCLKCLEKEPLRRYASAEILADEIRRFLDGRPIQARRPGLPERAWRWSRREPALALLALSLVIGLVGVTTQWWRAESHLARAVRHRRLAQDRLDIAMAYVKEVEDLVLDPAFQDARLETRRVGLLGTLRNIYLNIDRSLEKDDSADIRLKLATGYQRIARISFELGLRNEALAAAEHAVTIADQSVTASPDEVLLQHRLSSALSTQGFTLRVMGRPEEASVAYTRARAIQERLASMRSVTDLVAGDLAGTYSNLGLIELELGRPEEGVAFHVRAVAIRESLRSRSPSDPVPISDLAWAVRYQAQATSALGRFGDAEALIARAIGLLEPLASAAGADQLIRWRFARCLDEQGRLRLVMGRIADAAAPLERSAAALETLYGEYPAYYDDDFIRNRIYLATQRNLAGRPDDASALVRRAEDVQARSTKMPAEDFFLDLACGYALWSVSSTEGHAEPGEREPRTRRAIAAIRRWATAGRCKAESLHRDAALAPLREREDFQLLLMDLSFPDQPFGR
ncbi:serine/threonine-protein kinase [Aquisphaera insulae]|uniref:serine/threonine-protein kinase n=1 Tax=Aquisphaera insulae TaxID=2712864 RepID=UPI0013ED5103|nr:serine/threonine-protein kinase [Aquisphaera insulae]